MWTIVSQPQASELFADERRAARAVDVVVAEDRDPLPPLDCKAQTVGRPLHIGQFEGVRHQVAQGRIEVALDRLRRDASPGENAGDQLIVSTDLGESQGRASLRPRPAAPARAARARRSRRRERNSLPTPPAHPHPHPRERVRGRPPASLARKSPRRRAEDYHARERGDPEAGRLVGFGVVASVRPRPPGGLGDSANSARREQIPSLSLFFFFFFFF